MSHFHFCDIAGHQWTCEENTCSCICGLLMEGGDHGACPIELLACPEHHSSKSQSDESIFADALQSMLDDAEVMDDGDCGTKPESK